MVVTNEDALVCDLMETYGVTNWRALPVRFAATLAFGLSDSSRIKMAMAGAKVPLQTILLASAVDALRVLVWMQTEDAHKGKNQPQSLVEILTGNEKDESAGFDSIAEYEAARAAILEG